MGRDRKSLIDDLIEEAREQGMFDDLPGKGKPLNLKRNPYAAERELAHDLLKNNDLMWCATVAGVGDRRGGKRRSRPCSLMHPAVIRAVQ